jgi:hypothetical protein
LTTGPHHGQRDTYRVALTLFQLPKTNKQFTFSGRSLDKKKRFEMALFISLSSVISGALAVREDTLSDSGFICEKG